MGSTANAYGELTFDDVYNFPGDLNALQAFVNRFANVRRGTANDRGGLTAGQMRDGMFFVETDTGDVYLRRSGGWKHILGDSGWVALPMSNSWVNFGGGAYGDLRARRINGMVHVSGLVKGGDITPGKTMGTLPAGFRPGSYAMKGVPISGGAGTVDITPAGLILAGTVSATFTSLEFSFPAEG